MPAKLRSLAMPKQSNRGGLRVFLAFLCAFCTNAFAQTQLGADQQERAKALFGELRCVVCQNQSILDSDADVARDLREIVSEQITAGKSDSEIKGFLVERYGEFVLLKPVWSLHTFVLWVAPVLFLLTGLYLVWRSMRHQNDVAQKVELSDAEEKALNELLDKQNPGG